MHLNAFVECISGKLCHLGFVFVLLHLLKQMQKFPNSDSVIQLDLWGRCSELKTKYTKYSGCVSFKSQTQVYLLTEQFIIMKNCAVVFWSNLLQWAAHPGPVTLQEVLLRSLPVSLGPSLQWIIGCTETVHKLHHYIWNSGTDLDDVRTHVCVWSQAPITRQRKCAP